MYERDINHVLVERLGEPRRFIQFLSGPRQVGKTTSIKQVLARVNAPSHYASSDVPETHSRAWLQAQWDRAREIAASQGRCILVLDEVQKIPGWSDVVKGLWDEDTWSDRGVLVVLLGSAPWLMGRGLGESLTGRFETINATHWTYRECRDAFGWEAETFIFFGGYPGSAPLLAEERRWRSYVTENIVETTVTRDVLHLTRVDKPALLRRTFLLGCEYSGRELSLRKIQGQLEDAGNTTTIAHYLDLFEGAGLLSGLQKYAGEAVRKRASSPKLQVHNTALMSAISGRTFLEAREDHEWWGRVVESAVGATLIAAARRESGAVYYWRDGTSEVDFVYESGSAITLIEVKSGTSTADLRGFEAFERSFGPATRRLVVGTGGIGVEQFLLAEHFSIGRLA